RTKMAASVGMTLVALSTLLVGCASSTDDEGSDSSKSDEITLEGMTHVYRGLWELYLPPDETRTLTFANHIRYLILGPTGRFAARRWNCGGKPGGAASEDGAHSNCDVDTSKNCTVSTIRGRWEIVQRKGHRQL